MTKLIRSNRFIRELALVDGTMSVVMAPYALLLEPQLTRYMPIILAVSALISASIYHFENRKLRNMSRRGGWKMDKSNDPKITALNINLDAKQTPILYSDNIFISANEDGVVIDVGQRAGNTNQVQIVARVGMSRNQAKKLAEALSKNLITTQVVSQTGKKVVN